MIKPYTETYSDGWYERVFKADVESDELKWHRDQEDRYIEPVGFTDWMIQVENELPIKIQGTLFIGKYLWHRAIKGTGDLKIRIKKI
jgi:hypothetical protein